MLWNLVLRNKQKPWPQSHACFTCRPGQTSLWEEDFSLYQSSSLPVMLQPALPVMSSVIKRPWPRPHTPFFSRKLKLHLPAKNVSCKDLSFHMSKVINILRRSLPPPSKRDAYLTFWLNTCRDSYVGRWFPLLWEPYSLGAGLQAALPVQSSVTCRGPGLGLSPAPLTDNQAWTPAGRQQPHSHLHKEGLPGGLTN